MSCPQCEKYISVNQGFGGLNDFPTHIWKVIEGGTEKFDSASFYIPEGKAKCIYCHEVVIFKFDPYPHHDGYRFEKINKFKKKK